MGSAIIQALGEGFRVLVSLPTFDLLRARSYQHSLALLEAALMVHRLRHREIMSITIRQDHPPMGLVTVVVQ
jgi:hypothetical protein